VNEWLELNQRALTDELARIAARLEQHAAGETKEAQERSAPPMLEALADSFGLSTFERDVVLLCAGVELEARFAALCARASGDERLRAPTFGLALACLAEPHWSALAPAGPLRHWRLVELEVGESITTRRLHVDERVLHHLTGLHYLDERLKQVADPVEPPPELPSSQAVAAARVAHACSGTYGIPQAAILVTGADADTRRDVASRGAADAGFQVHAAASTDLPAQADDRATVARLWERELALSRNALLVEVGDGADGDAVRRLTAFVEAMNATVIVSSNEPVSLGRRASARIDVARPKPAEQRGLWKRLLGEPAESLNGSLDALTAHFDLPRHAIEAASAEASGEAPLETALWRACRAQSRPRLDDLAQRIDPVAGWDDIVLPATQLEILGEIAAQVRGRSRVYNEWGFARKSTRGLGLSALFEGASGTGKTMAAEVLALELDVDLYSIDLSQVVSKYIGETEKNLRRLFDAAETGAAILLFDEADALFGKRSEVKDSHDRYANIEVSYLLQRMESYRGLAILTTNARDAIDHAFMRRIRFVVSFPFPDEEQRVEIWRRVFPAETPTEEIDHHALARLSLAGGSIRNIALSAAFFAADKRSPVRMSHLARAAVRECAKLERPLTEAEVRAWL
jgi:hypothetical protein